ncbi:hypothetical protein PPROV_000015500 [Pycnococcus provasolii]|uniref:Alpha N-terminal protein methyltransferase 1 n=1 Tax=Pycnococcus provasolii TaxID=41880 RepID=A0A6U0D512_9CHLO|nr:hypothetical protein PPROV_000015500 [Pycnococcus provasolii]|eukprot:CAMPEP_0206133532 /NCGR_PEP_ID=MMETSP1472-20131121/53765_1 /ASSEMBLY_ACC=CAM_ASM_001108 /TAXON_ID=41880 /ORGANISM="Pycnococcus provasolii, Strain RCC251" /LENGTH=271 /DNA_ID=CAMNT_0053525105 /DNA_START=50 /DNA_END=865 /DNA_ORIENTATION=+
MASSQFPGESGDGTVLTSSKKFWEDVTEGGAGADPNDKSKGWYGTAIQYWSNAPPTVDGVLGGFGHVSPTDVAASTQFLQDAAPHICTAGNEHTCALDCGAGVGRVTNEFLRHHFSEVHLVEPVEALIEEARRTLVAKRAKTEETNTTKFSFFAEPLQTFTPAPKTYDVIWIQWVIGHLTDDHFLDFFARCAEGLKDGGMIFVKENNATAGRGFIVDSDDSSVTRSDAYLCELFEKANFQMVAKRRQKEFPQELYPVRMYALKPRASTLKP